MLNPVKIVYLGDSITCGQYVWRELCWTSIVTERLIKSSGALIHNVNSGINGETTRLGLERFSEVQRSCTDILTIQYGMNDCNCWETDCGVPRVSPEAFEANIIEMVHRAWNFKINKIILINNPKTLKFNILPNHKVYETCNAEYSSIIESVARKIGTMFCDIRNSLLINRETIYPDGIHLNENGHKLYADIIYLTLKLALDSVLEERRKNESLG